MSVLVTSTIQVSGYRELRPAVPGAALGTDHAEVPTHLAPLVEALADLVNVRENWNCYNARVPSVQSLRRTLQLLCEVDWRGPLPTVTPTSSGGIVLEWGDDDAGVEIEIRPDNQVGILVDADTSNRWECLVNDARDPRLSEALIWAEKLA